MKKMIPDIHGLCWSEYNWCGTRLFVGAVYWPPTRKGDNEATRKRYSRRVKKIIGIMDKLSNFGIVLLQGDLNAQMGRKFVKESPSGKTNSHGRAWIEHL